MSSPCPRLVRCRVRDLASCFYACRLPLEEEPDNSCTKSPRFSSHGRTICDPKSVCGAHKSKTPVDKMPEKDGEGRLVDDLDFSRDSSRGGPRAVSRGNRLEPRFAEEDYIVFCFREDGEIDMINNNEGNYEASEAYHHDSGIDQEHENTVAAAPTLWPVINRKKGDETVCVEMGVEWKPNHNLAKEMNSFEQPNSASKMESFESCDSNLSDTTSTSSFAFPVLGLDWIGSPVHMPVSETPDSPSLSLNCCSF